MCEQITILYLDTKFGQDMFAFEDDELAWQLIDAHVQKFWPVYFSEIPMPEDPDAARESYFEIRYSDSFTIDEVVPLHTIEEVHKVVEEF